MVVIKLDNVDEPLDFDDPEIMAIFRKIIGEDLIRITNGHHQNSTEKFIGEICEEYYPDNLEKQIDLFMCVMECITRSEQLGYEGIPTDILNSVADKYKVTGVINIEKISVLSNKSSGILGDVN